MPYTYYDSNLDRQRLLLEERLRLQDIDDIEARNKLARRQASKDFDVGGMSAARLAIKYINKDGEENRHREDKVEYVKNLRPKI